MSETLDLQEFSQLFQVTEKAVRDWIKAGMPVASKGSRGGGKDRDKTQINLRDAAEWYFAENYERLELDRQRTRLASEQAQKIAIENAVRISEVGELKLWQQELEKLFGEIRAALLSLPTKLAPRLDGDVNQRKDRIESAVHEVLRQLASHRPSSSGAADSQEDVDGAGGSRATAEADGESVGGPIPKAVKRKQRGTRRVGN